MGSDNLPPHKDLSLLARMVLRSVPFRGISFARDLIKPIDMNVDRVRELLSKGKLFKCCLIFRKFHCRSLAIMVKHSRLKLTGQQGRISIYCS